MGSFVFLMTQHEPDGEPGWVRCGPCRARITNDGDGPRASLVHSSEGLAAGLVRLDNRGDISRRVRCESNQSDLAIIVAALVREGPSCIRWFEGDFAFAFWDANRQTLIAARDSLGVRALFCSADVKRPSFASQARLIGAHRPWSLEYIADYIGGRSRGYTPYDGIGRVPAATYRIVQNERSADHCYWSPFEFETTWTLDRASAVDQFTTLFKDALRVHLVEDGGCWSHLSGGLDSSSVVSMAGWLSRADATVPPLRGTITIVDTVGMGDERAYSDTVIRDWPVRNEQIIDYREWEDSDAVPPEIDEPSGLYQWFARDQFVIRTMRSTGSRVLLAGIGPDNYLHGNYTYFADWIARGRIRDAVHEMYLEALRNKVSFWKLAYRNGVKPFLPVRNASRWESWPWPEWVHPDFARRFPPEEGQEENREYTGALGRRFATQAAAAVAYLEFGIMRGIIGDGLDVRYPYLHRPLVEFSLQLPPELKVSDGKHKWILREAMRGILPEEIRQRTSKGFINVGADRSLTDQHARLDSLLERSVLGDMGCIDVGLARKALTQRTQRQFSDNRQLENLLTLETWFTVKLGRWNAREVQRSASQHLQALV
jgi:asparagine synthase (glutamine-hydrolysing)